MRAALLIAAAAAGFAVAAPQGMRDDISSLIITPAGSTPTESVPLPSSTPSAVDDSDFNILPPDFTQDSTGFVHLADDGVLRSYAANGTILAALPFSNAQIKRMIDTAPVHLAPMRPHLLSVYDTVSGHAVHPDQHLNPPREMRHHEHGGPEPYQDDEMYAEVDRLYKKSMNEFEEVKRELEGRNSYCIGKRCSSTAACGLMGCMTCMTWDRAVGGQRYCFFEQFRNAYWNHGDGLKKE